MNTQYSKPSDQTHRIKVDSAVIRAQWLCGRAWAGAEAPFEVRTALVGDGAEVKVRLVNDAGKVLEKKSDKILSNRCRGTIAVPSKVKLGDMLRLEVELPKHGLDAESGEVPAGPVIQARKLAWDKKEARRGDTVVMKAEFIDLPDRTQAGVTIYEYDPEGLHDPVAEIPAAVKNDRLELKWEFKPRDAGTILTAEELRPYGKNYRAPEYFFTVTIDGTRIGTKQESGLLRFADSASITLKDENGSPLENKEATIILADGSKKSIRTDGKGKAFLDSIPPGRFTITLDG